MKKWSYLLLPLLFPATASLAGRADSAREAASARYSHPNILQRIFIGGNYRRTWSTPVQMKVFDITKEKGGLTVTKLGGGMQTRSLRMEDKAGNEWTLRTVDKTVDKALEAEGIKSGFIKDITQEMISAAHPYGALTVKPMAKALGIVSAAPELVYVPDDPDLGEYRKMFAGTVCLLELREPVFSRNDGTESTDDLRKELAKQKGASVDQQMLLQARLLDMLIGDWDRHDDQWRWGYAKGGKGEVYYPIPRDHDQAYFHSNGLLIPLVRPFTMKHLVGFRKHNLKLKALNRKEWKFDRLLMKDLTPLDWENGIRRFQVQLTDSVLQAAARQLPDEIYALHGEDLYRRLRKRRDAMAKHGMRYQRFLYRKVPLPDLKEPFWQKKEGKKDDK